MAGDMRTASVIETSEAPPSYDEVLQSTSLQEHMGVTDDGRVNLDPNSRLFRTLSRFVPDFKAPVPPEENESEASAPQLPEPPSYSDAEPASQDAKPRHWHLRLNIVIQIVGSRGDVQPFVALGNELQKWGHRVRLATHDVFEQFVTESGLEFFPIGGNPSELMAYMVKNPGLIPNIQSLGIKEIQKKRQMVSAMLDGCWRSCIDPDPRTNKPFVADCIIANPPSFAHVHCSQALGVPLHLMFTMPWSTTKVFPHPLANMTTHDMTTRNQQVSNFVSYSMVEWMTWQGLGDVINDWRKTLDLEPVPLSEGPALVETLRIPFTYCWSPSLLSKPEDWDNHIDVCGFFFRDPPDYSPPSDLAAFLEAGSAPVYIGFGSIVIDDPKKVTEMILEAVKLAGVRAIISRGWSSLSSDEPDEDIFYIDDCPHEWLFQHVKAVVHHGGAGTTACGLRYGRPTAIVSFFGDQPFWGHSVAAANAGPPPIPYKTLSSKNLASSIEVCLRDDIVASAQTIATKMKQESGVKRAVQAFHSNLPITEMSCDVLSDHPAVWTYKRKGKTIKLSGVAAEVLTDHLKIDQKKLQLHVSSPIMIENQRWDPITGTASAAVATYYGMFSSVANIFIKPVKVYRTATAMEDAKGKNKLITEDNTISSASSINSVTTTGLAPLPSSHLHRSSSTGNLTSHTSTSVSSDTKSAKKHSRGTEIAADMAMASASGVGDFFKAYSKGVLVDLPLAFAEGSRQIPRLYGDQVRDYGTVTDWKSGLAVSGKNFLFGLGEGFAGLAMKPVEGAMESGVTGGVLGVAKGFVGFSAKVSSATFGTVAYPALGIYKSLRTAIKTKTRKSISKARQEESKRLLIESRSSEYPIYAEVDIINKFDSHMKALKTDRNAKTEQITDQMKRII